jgi:nucleotidyltransferase substrate binding protein (TIGR01987 family)
MSKPQLELLSLTNACQRLAEGWIRYQQNQGDTQLRDGLIQRFEFTYELSHKMLKRYLETTSATPDAFDAMPFADMIRTGNEQGLLRSDWPRWRLFREMRGKSSHTYDENVALAVVADIPAFMDEAQFLLAQLQARTL